MPKLTALYNESDDVVALAKEAKRNEYFARLAVWHVDGSKSFAEAFVAILFAKPRHAYK